MSPASAAQRHGRAEAEDLNLDSGPLYDPLVNYNAMRMASPTGMTAADAVSTRTAPAGSNSRSRSHPSDRRRNKLAVSRNS